MHLQAAKRALAGGGDGVPGARPARGSRRQGSLPLAGAKQRALLALLLVHANHVLSRDRLIDELWGERAARDRGAEPAGLRLAAAQAAAAETLLTRPPGYLLEVEPDELDLQRFERLLGEGREALAEGDPDARRAALHDALALWRGPALAEFAFEPFAQAEIGRLEDLRLAAVEERIEADLALGRHADLIGELEALVAENPYRERLRGQLMLALYRSGRQAEALEAYRNARRALVDELGIEPSAALQRLEKQILTQDEALDTRRTHGGPSGRAPPPLERKHVTVLFADLGMANELEEDPERAGAFLAESTARRPPRSRRPAAPSRKASQARCSRRSARRTHARRITPSARSAPRSPRADG